MSDLANTPVPALLELAASQLEVASHVSQAQVDLLASSIGSLVLLGTELQAAQEAGTIADSLASKIVERAHTALMAMQFHDQLVQRVAHVRDALTELNEALNGTPAAELMDVRLALVEVTGTGQEPVVRRRARTTGPIVPCADWGALPVAWEGRLRVRAEAGFLVPTGDTPPRMYPVSA